MTNFYPSITEVVPPAYPDLRQEFGKLESLMWNARKPKVAPTATLPEANDRYELFGVFSQESEILICQLEHDVVQLHVEDRQPLQSSLPQDTHGRLELHARPHRDLRFLPEPGGPRRTIDSHPLHNTHR